MITGGAMYGVRKQTEALPMSVVDSLRADRAALAEEMRREGRLIVFAMVGTVVGMLLTVAAAVVAFPFVAAYLRTFWASHGVAL